MRKLSEEEQSLLLYRSDKEMAKRRKRNFEQRVRRSKFKRRYPHKPAMRNPEFHQIVAPMDIDFDANYDQSNKLIESLRRFTLAKGLTVMLDMSRCHRISPDAALVLAAEIQRIMSLRGKCVNGFNPRIPKAAAILDQLGFHELLGYRKFKTNKSDFDPNVTFIKMVPGHGGNLRVIPEIIDDVLGGAAQTSNPTALSSLRRALNEAIHNAVQHAYDDEKALIYPRCTDHSWWIAGYRDQAKREITFMFLDQGVSIPYNLPKKWKEQIRTVVKQVISMDSHSVADNDMLRAAIGIGRTSTDKGGRGWGLSEMRSLIGPGLEELNGLDISSLKGAGSLKILSRRGKYLYKRQEGKPPTEISLTMKKPFLGTLVVWKLGESDVIEWCR